MNFTRITEWAQVSECQRYSVSASVDSDTLGSKRKVRRYLFTAWRRNPDGPPDILLIDADPEKCRQACRDHAAKEVA